MNYSTAGSNILLVYTGGTIGMVQDPETGLFKPFDFESLSSHIPEIRNFDFHIDSISFQEPKDSSNMGPEDWLMVCKIIEENYRTYDGFVILHGSDTMAYTSTMLSFLLEGLNKPVVFTGSQLPIGVLRTDGKENLITSLEFAAAKENGQPLIPEVCIYFENKLYRANRTTKFNAEHFEAFVSPSYPSLAKAGVTLTFKKHFINTYEERPLKIHGTINSEVALIKIFPGMPYRILDSVIDNGFKALVVESFGSGNAPNNTELVDRLAKIKKSGLGIFNVSQCLAGTANMNRYATNEDLLEVGICDLGDMTTEACICKLMFLMGQNYNGGALEGLMKKSLRGEITE